MQVASAQAKLTADSSSLTHHFFEQLDLLGPFPDQPHLAVALSGGADSLALTLLAAEWAARHRGSITALTVDHRLRAESTAEAETVAAWMKAHGIAHRILTPEHTPNSNNLQEAAREWRYRALADFCRERAVLHCLVGHTAGDNRETVQHHLLRGETADGGSGMRRIRNAHGIRFLRPLLEMERGALEAYLHTQDLRWIEDPSNRNTRFSRVRLRNDMQQNVALTSALDLTILQQSAARVARDHTLAEAAMRVATILPYGMAELDFPAWRTLPQVLASQLLADCITTVSGFTNRPRAADTARLMEALLQPDFRKRTLQQCEISLKNNRLRIARELAYTQAAISLSGNGECIWDKRFHVRYDLPPGQCYMLAALGLRGARDLRETGHDLAPSTPTLYHLDARLGVPHIGMPQAVAASVRIGFAPPKPLAAAPFW